MASNTFPSDWAEQPCFLAVVPRPLVPYVAGLMKILEARGFWASEEDYERGYAAAMQTEGCMMATCLTDLIESNDRIYRLLDTIHNGQLYAASGDTPDTITPVIPLVPARGVVNDDSMMGRSQIIIEALESYLAGVDTPHYSGTPNVHTLLQAIIDALAEVGTDDAAMLEKLTLILGAL